MSRPSFAPSLYRCDDETSVVVAGGNRFIRKLPDGRPLAYLHKLHAPLDDGRLRTLAERLGPRLDPCFQSFLRWSNGASLFDNQIELFGLIEHFPRSLALEKQQPISIVHQNEEFRRLHGARWRDGWTQIGSVIGWDSNHSIELRLDGECALRSEDRVYSVSSFEACLSAIVDRVGACYSCDGLIDQSYAQVDGAVASLFHPQ